MPDQIEEILNERGTTHGPFYRQAKCTQDLKKTMSEFNYRMLSPMQSEALDMIAHKMARILTGDPDLDDHWNDIAGYAKLPVRFKLAKLTDRGSMVAPLPEGHPSLDEAIAAGPVNIPDNR